MLKNSAIYLTANIANVAVPFLLIPVLTKYLTPEEYGTLAMFQLTAAAFSTLIGLEGVGAVTRKYYDRNKDGDDYKHYTSALLQIFLACCSFFVLTCLVFGYQISAFFFLPIQYLWAALGVGASGFLILLRLSIWQAESKAIKYGVLQVSQSLINFLITILLVSVFYYGSDGRISAVVIGAVLCAIAAVCSLYKDGMLLSLRWRPSYVNIKSILAYGLPLLPHSIGIYLLSSVDRYFINSTLGSGVTGVFMVAMQISLVLSLLFTSMNNAFSPWLFENLVKSNSKFHLRLVRGTYTYFFILIILALSGFLFGPWFISIFIDSKYSEAQDIIGIIVVGQCFLGAQLSVINYLFYTKETKYISVASLTTGLFYILVLYFSLNQFGLFGAAMAFSTSMALRFFLLWFFANKTYPMPWFSAIKYRNFG